MASLSDSIVLPFSRRRVKNRFVKAAMTERMSTWDPLSRSTSGIPTAQVSTLYRRWGNGGIGIIVTGAITVDPAYLEAPGNSIIGETLETAGVRYQGFQDLATAAKGDGAILLGQLNHTGRQTIAALHSCPVSASDVQLGSNELGMAYNKPHAASIGEIHSIQAAFVHGAKYLHAAGFDGVQINAAHGYLVDQFLSPTTNHRNDHYGSPDRARFLVEIVRAIRETCPPDFVISVKLNCFEYQVGIESLYSAKTICGLLETEHVDMIELSAGTYQEFGWKHKAGFTTESREGYFLDAAEAIRPVLDKTLLYVTGGFFTAQAMGTALQWVDGIGLGRALAQEPDLCRRLLQGESECRVRQKLGQADFYTTALLAGSQMRQMAMGREPLDATDEKVVKEFLAKIPAWIKDVTENNPTGDKFGHLDVEVEY